VSRTTQLVARTVALLCAVLVLVLVLGSLAVAQDTKELVNREISKPVFRGSIVFKSYCSLCHGERGDGSGRAAKLYAELHLAIAPRSPEYYEKVIRHGGRSVGGSAYMPPWQDELSEEQIGDVLTYLTIVGDTVRRGEAVYKTNCILCHGIQGDGKGRAASLFHPPPADLTHSDKNDEYKTAIIRLGGVEMGRSSGMPPWEERLTEIEVRDLVGYLRTLLAVPPKP
jgi:cbb3-type cytochrome c oxidase subunit III